MPRNFQDLTDRQSDVLDAIRESIRGRGFPPTVREICDRVGIANPNGVAAHLAALERKGYISREPKTSRGIKVLRRK